MYKTPVTVNLRGGTGVDFDQVLNIRRYEDFEDEPTIPFGLCQSDYLESAETLVMDEHLLITEKDIVDEYTDWRYLIK